MVSCTSNTSQSFPMFNELKLKIEFHYMDQCFDAFQDVLIKEMNLEGVVYFYKSVYSAVFEQIAVGFTPAE